MASGYVAALVAALIFGFVEGVGRFYPARPTWLRLRRARGRFAIRRMRERFEDAAARSTPRWIAALLFVLVIVWIVVSRNALAKRWWEVAIDVLPYLFVAIALLRTPTIMGKVAERMKDYERQSGEDPDKPLDDDIDRPEGPSDTIAL